MHWDGYGWGWGFGWIFMVLFWIVMVAVGIFLVRWLMSSAQRREGAQSSETALDILKKRYARGEITRDEYERTKKDIS